MTFTGHSDAPARQLVDVLIMTYTLVVTITVMSYGSGDCLWGAIRTYLFINIYEVSTLLLH